MFGVSSLLIACGLLSGAHALGTLKQGGTLVHFGGLLVVGLFGAWTALTADFAYHGAASPDGRQELLIVNSSVLLLGSFEVYAPSCGAALERRAHLTTNNGYDPFAAGQYSIQFSADSATISYVHDYMHPEILETITVPLNTNEECA